MRNRFRRGLGIINSRNVSTRKLLELGVRCDLGAAQKPNLKAHIQLELHRAAERGENVRVGRDFTFTSTNPVADFYLESDVRAPDTCFSTCIGQFKILLHEENGFLQGAERQITVDVSIRYR